MTKLDEVLSEIKTLKSWLYGANGHEGDITEIKNSLRKVNDRSIKNRLMIYCLIVAGAGGGGVAITKLLELVGTYGG